LLKGYHSSTIARLGKEERLPAVNKTQTNIYLSDEAREALRALAVREGGSASAVVERLIREKARKEGLKIKGLTT
jgi:hypothetical protein